MKWLVLGDVHGEWFDANKVIDKALKKHPDITKIIQVGDLGLGWPTWDKKIQDITFHDWNVAKSARDKGLKVHWLDGNHENFDRIEMLGGSGNPDVIYQPRGSVLEDDGVRVMFMGGALSIDRAHRHLGISYWEQETITLKDLDKALSNEGEFDAIFSHDRPDCFPCPFTGHNGQKDLGGMSDRVALENIWHKFKPKFWFFGHYHNADRGLHEGTDWTLCPMIGNYGCNGYTIWDGKTVERSWEQHQI